MPLSDGWPSLTGHRASSVHTITRSFGRRLLPSLPTMASDATRHGGRRYALWVQMAVR